MYRLYLHPNIEKQLSRIHKGYAERLANAMRSLREDPRPVQSKHLGQEMYRVREGEYRIVYAVFDKEQVVFVGKIGRRSEKIYRNVAILLATAHKVVKGK